MSTRTKAKPAKGTKDATTADASESGAAEGRTA